MPDTYTGHLALVKPEIGASRDTWGTKTNGNWDALDAFVFQAMPIGAMLDFGGPNAPSGWLVCDGRTVSRTTYSALFAAIGVYWGAGDGSTTFALPNPNGRASIGPGTGTDANGTAYSYSFTQKLGAVTNVIAKVNLPNYAMTSDTQGSHSHGGATVGAGAHAHTTDAQGTHSHGGATANAGDHSHTGYTDYLGDHTHGVTAGYMNIGGNFVAGGGATTLNNTGLTTSTAGAHQHNIQTYNAGIHAHTINADGSHAHNVSAVGDHTHGINADGGHAHTISLGGSGTGFSVLNPVLVVTKIIYAGQQAAVLLEGLASPVGLLDQMEATDDLAAIRQELAELRAILAPPRTGRLLQTPSRGPH